MTLYYYTLASDNFNHKVTETEFCILATLNCFYLKKIWLLILLYFCSKIKKAIASNDIENKTSTGTAYMFYVSKAFSIRFNHVRNSAQYSEIFRLLSFL